MALDCFERAGNPRLVDAAYAHQLLKTAQQEEGVHWRHSANVQKAAHLLIRAGRFSEALKCCLLCGHHKHASMLIRLVEDFDSSLASAAQELLRSRGVISL